VYPQLKPIKVFAVYGKYLDCFKDELIEKLLNYTEYSSTNPGEPAKPIETAASKQLPVGLANTDPTALNVAASQTSLSMLDLLMIVFKRFANIQKLLSLDMLIAARCAGCPGPELD
jgi:hypothetical protein